MHQYFRAITDRINHLGEAVLHQRPDGGTEWLFGYFNDLPQKDPVSGLHVDLHDQNPLLTLLATDAVNLCKYKTLNHYQPEQEGGSVLIIRGMEYRVNDVMIDHRGHAKVLLSQDCKPVKHPVATPDCLQAGVIYDPSCRQPSEQDIINSYRYAKAPTVTPCCCGCTPCAGHCA